MDCGWNPTSTSFGTSWRFSHAGQRRAFTEFSRSRPTDWRPGQVRNPQDLLVGYFTESAAWELIAERLEAGQDLEVVSLNRPPGKKAYVMLIDLEEASPPLYVKLELGAGKIYGRSFHYSTHT